VPSLASRPPFRSSAPAILALALTSTGISGRSQKQIILIQAIIDRVVCEVRSERGTKRKANKAWCARVLDANILVSALSLFSDVVLNSIESARSYLSRF